MFFMFMFLVSGRLRFSWKKGKSYQFSPQTAWPGLFRIGPRGRSPDVSPDTMRQAIEIGRYLIPHAKAAFQTIRIKPGMEDAHVLQKWIVNRARRGQSEFTRSEAQQSHTGRFPNVTDIDGPLAILEGQNMCRPAPAKAKQGRGRPPVWFEINPALVSKCPET
jgi:hypothetical protein